MSKQNRVVVAGWDFGDASAQVLLTREEEVQLAKRMEAGVRAEALLAHKRISGRLKEGQENRLMAKIKRGLEARQTLVEKNLRLVVALAAEFFKSNTQLDLADLIGEGNLGLLRAVEGFDWRKGCKVSTYATWWIWQALQRGTFSHGRMIRLPIHILNSIAACWSVKREFFQQFHREPTHKEIARRTRLSVAAVADIEKFAQGMASLDSLLEGESEASLQCFLADTREITAARAEEMHSLQNEVQDALRYLNKRERLIISKRFGLDDGEILTLKEIGRQFGVTREAIRLAEGRILLKLKRHEALRKRIRDG